MTPPCYRKARNEMKHGTIKMPCKAGSCVTQKVMQCDTPNKAAFRDLPPGFLIRPCRRDELDIWMRVVVEAQYVKYVAEF